MKDYLGYLLFGCGLAGMFGSIQKEWVALFIWSPFILIYGLNLIIDKKIDAAKKDILNKIKNNE